MFRRRALRISRTQPSLRKSKNNWSFERFVTRHRLGKHVKTRQNWPRKDTFSIVCVCEPSQLCGGRRMLKDRSSFFLISPSDKKREGSGGGGGEEAGRIAQCVFMARGFETLGPIAALWDGMVEWCVFGIITNLSLRSSETPRELLSRFSAFKSLIDLLRGPEGRREEKWKQRGRDWVGQLKKTWITTTEGHVEMSWETSAL